MSNVIQYYLSKYPLKAVGKVTRASAEGVTLSGIHMDKTDHNRAFSALYSGNSGETRKGAEGARRKPNLSGKRTEPTQTEALFARFGAICIFSGAVF